MGQRSKKGSKFEREFCVHLSKWFSRGKADDWFWRTAGSGGRATVRGRQGKRSTGHYGDVCATCPDGEDFLSVVTLELKRGYNRATLHDLLDKSALSAEQTYAAWIKQAKESAKHAGTRYWMVVHKRDLREPIVLMPFQLQRALEKWGAFPNQSAGWNAGVFKFLIDLRDVRVAAVPLHTFFTEVQPEIFRSLANLYRGE